MTFAATLAGAAAGVLLALAEIAWLRLATPAALPPVGGTLGLLLAVVPRGFLAGAALGLGQGLGLAAIDRAARWCGRRRGHEPACFAALVAAAAMAGLVGLARPLLGGRQARLLTAHPVLLVILGAAVAWCLYEIALAWRLAPGWIRASRSARAARLVWRLVAATLVAVAGAAYLFDRLVLVRLYEPFHLGLRLAVFTSLELAIVTLYLRGRTPAGPRPFPRGLGASCAIVALALALAVAHAHQTPASRRAAVNLVRLHGAAGGSLVALTDAVTRSWRRHAAPASGIGPAPLPLPADRAERAAPLGPGANVLLITIDALRADHLTPYGYARDTSPQLGRLAQESVVFERAYTSAPHTSFALASLLTGHPAMSLSERGLLDDRPTLADLARANGYRTAAFFPPAVFFVDGERFESFRQRAFGFERMFAKDLPETSSAPEMTDRILAYLADQMPERFLVWAHYFAPHEPYVDHPDGPPGFGKRAVDRYDGEILWVDREIGRLVATVRARHPRTIVVITADHGEEFGEHGGAYHGTTLFDEQVRVPLIVSIPDVTPRRIGRAVSTTSLVPTLLDLVGIDADVDFDGPTLTPWLAGDDAAAHRPDPVFVENAQHRMVVSGHDKLLCATRNDDCVLYDLARDPAELVDLSPARPDRVRALRDALALWVARHDDLSGRAGSWARLADARSAPAVRRDAARAIARRPERGRASELRRAWSTEADPAVKAWLSVALAAIGDVAARAALPALVDGAEDTDGELLGEAALARDRMADERAASDLATALPRVADVNLRCALMHALAKWRTPAAAAALLGGYDVIRSRICCATALSTLRDPSTVPFMLARLPDEPYTVVQTALVRALGAIGDRSALPVLRSLRDATPEAELAQAIDGVLGELEGRPSGT
jgi:arylsulfatase A-like enzyme